MEGRWGALTDPCAAMSVITASLLPQIKTFGVLVKGKGTLLDEYVALVDGVFLNEVMFQM